MKCHLLPWCNNITSEIHYFSKLQVRLFSNIFHLQVGFITQIILCFSILKQQCVYNLKVNLNISVYEKYYLSFIYLKYLLIQLIEWFQLLELHPLCYFCKVLDRLLHILFYKLNQKAPIWIFHITVLWNWSILRKKNSLSFKCLSTVDRKGSSRCVSWDICPSQNARISAKKTLLSKLIFMKLDLISSFYGAEKTPALFFAVAK